MKEICIEKFKEGICRDKMHEAYLDKVKLIEAVWKPRNGSIWGTGLSKEQTMYTRRDMWPGKNQLGQILNWVMSYMFDEGYSEEKSDQEVHTPSNRIDSIGIMSVEGQSVDATIEEGEITSNTAQAEGNVKNSATDPNVKPKSTGNRQTDDKSQIVKANRRKAKGTLPKSKILYNS